MASRDLETSRIASHAGLGLTPIHARRPVTGREGGLAPARRVPQASKRPERVKPTFPTCDRASRTTGVLISITAMISLKIAHKTV